MVRDVQRAMLALEQKYALAVGIAGKMTADPFAEIVNMATLRNKGRVAASPETLAATLDAALQASDSLWSTAPDEAFYCLAEIGWQAGRLGDLLQLPSVVQGLMAADVRRHRAPLVLLQVWRDLLLAVLECRRGAPARLAGDLLHHYRWRLTRRDAVVISSHALGVRGLSDRFQGIYVRSPTLPWRHDVVVFECLETRAVLTASQAPTACPVLEVESRVELHNALAFFTSQSRQAVPPASSFWVERRGWSPPVFPDAGSEEEPGAPLLGLPDLAILERLVEFLPNHFGYLVQTSRGQDSDDTLALEARVNGFLAKPRHRGRKRQRRPALA